MPSYRNQSDLLRLRIRANLSRRELATRCGLSQSCIFSAEMGTHKIRAQTELIIRRELSAAIYRAENVKRAQPFTMRCRWCGDPISDIGFDAHSGQMLVKGRAWSVYAGWFYHSACLEEKRRIDSTNCENEITKSKPRL